MNALHNPSRQQLQGGSELGSVDFARYVFVSAFVFDETDKGAFERTKLEQFIFMIIAYAGNETRFIKS